nr:MAG: hypothetical protein DIU61_16095 [Bacteroidota bacterium]
MLFGVSDINPFEGEIVFFLQVCDHRARCGGEAFRKVAKISSTFQLPYVILCVLCDSKLLESHRDIGRIT